MSRWWCQWGNNTAVSIVDTFTLNSKRYDLTKQDFGLITVDVPIGRRLQDAFQAVSEAKIEGLERNREEVAHFFPRHVGLLFGP